VTAIAFVLSAIAGYVDSLGFQLLRGVFTSHITGDTAHFGTYIVDHRWNDVYRYGWPILMFLTGLLVSAAVTSVGKKIRFHSTFGIALGAEAILLLASPIVTNYYGLTAMFACAMGLQTLTVTNLPAIRVYTTYMTGNLAKFAEGAVKFVVNGDRTELRHSIVTGVIWLMFWGGVMAAAAAHQIWDRYASLLPGSMVAVIAIFDFARPVDPCTEGGG
jgi:uncharacterized membrane protein YoaK (UPF0700 family)